MRLVMLVEDAADATPYAVNPERVIHCRAVVGPAPAVNIVFTDDRPLGRCQRGDRWIDADFRAGI